MKRIWQQLIVFFSFISLIFATTIVYAAEDTHTENDFSVSDFSAIYYVSSSKGLNVRSGPSTDYDKIATLTYAQAVTITGKTNNDWYRISINNKEGYVSSKYLSTQSPIANSDSNDDIITEETELSSELTSQTQDIISTIRSSIIGNHIILLFIVIILVVICIIIFTAYSFIKDSKTANEYSDISNDDDYNYYDTSNSDDYNENYDESYNEDYYNCDDYIDSDDEFQ